MQFDITQAATWIPIIAGVILPFFVALLAKQNATGLVKSLIAAVGAGLATLAVYLEAGDSLSWEGAVSAFVLAVVVAGASRITLTGGADDALAAKVPGGIG